MADRTCPTCGGTRLLPAPGNAGGDGAHTVCAGCRPLAGPQAAVLTDGDRVVVRLVGHLGGSVAAAVEDVLSGLRATGCDRVALDLQRVSGLDGAGIRALLAWALRAAAEGSVLEVQRGPAHVEQVLAREGVRPILGPPAPPAPPAPGCPPDRPRRSEAAGRTIFRRPARGR